MPITFLLDENLPSRIWRAIQRHNEHNADILDVVCVGQSDDLPFSVDDPSILLWAERQGRILITEDKSTMPAHLAAHLDMGATLRVFSWCVQRPVYLTCWSFWFCWRTRANQQSGETASSTFRSSSVSFEVRGLLLCPMSHKSSGRLKRANRWEWSSRHRPAFDQRKHYHHNPPRLITHNSHKNHRSNTVTRLILISIDPHYRPYPVAAGAGKWLATPLLVPLPRCHSGGES